MSLRKILACIALSIGCASGHAQVQGFAQEFLNAAGLSKVGSMIGTQPNTRQISPAQGVQSSSIFATPDSDAQRSRARGYMLNDGVSAQIACQRAVLPTTANPYTRAQCEQDMEPVVAERDDLRQQKRSAEQAQFSEIYPKVLEQAVEASLTSGTTDFACDNALRDVRSISAEKSDKVVSQCEKDMRPMYYQRVRDPSFKALNCDQWAIKKGDAWRVAPVSMQYKPLSKSTDPEQFSGELKNVEDSRWTVISDYYPAYVDVDSSTVIFNRDKIQVGSVASGYGVISGKENVQLTTGAQMTIPVFKAACID